MKGTIKEMNRAFPDANIVGFEEHILPLDLPDLNDRHVLAAGIQGKVQKIVTFNLKDFPKSALKKHAIEPRHPDQFILDLIDHDPS